MVLNPRHENENGSSDSDDEADHLQNYFLAGISAIERFNELSVAHRNAGRASYLPTGLTGSAPTSCSGGGPGCLLVDRTRRGIRGRSAGRSWSG
jgi:hypothetical protein